MSDKYNGEESTHKQSLNENNKDNKELKINKNLIDENLIEITSSDTICNTEIDKNSTTHDSTLIIANNSNKTMNEEYIWEKTLLDITTNKLSLNKGQANEVGIPIKLKESFAEKGNDDQNLEAKKIIQNMKEAKVKSLLVDQTKDNCSHKLLNAQSSLKEKNDPKSTCIDNKIETERSSTK